MIAQSLASALTPSICDGSAFYLKLQATAQKLIKQFGVQMVLTQATSPAYDPQTDTVTHGSTSSNFYGVRFPIAYSKVGRRALTPQADGETIRSTDESILCQLNIAPKVLDKISDGARDYVIANIAEIAPGCVPVMYDLAVRA